MSGLKNMGVMVQEYVYDFAVDGGGTGAYVLSSKAGVAPVPLGSVIKGVTAKILTTFATSASGTVSWGNGDAADGYSGTTIAAASLTANLVINGWDLDASLLWDGTNDHPIYVHAIDANDALFKLTITTGAITAGKAIFMVEYYTPSL
jgi:hypothetical protein